MENAREKLEVVLEAVSINKSQMEASIKAGSYTKHDKALMLIATLLSRERSAIAKKIDAAMTN